MPPGNPLVRVAHAIESAVGFACNAVMLVAGLGLLALLTSVVVLRYVFQQGLTFAPDLGELLFALFVLAGIVEAARRGAHVATQVLMHALPPRGRVALALVINAVTAVVYGLLSRYAFENALIAHTQTTPVLRIPWSVGYGALSLALGLVALCGVTAIIRHLAGGEGVATVQADPEATSP